MILLKKFTKFQTNKLQGLLSLVLQVFLSLLLVFVLVLVPVHIEFHHSNCITVLLNTTKTKTRTTVTAFVIIHNNNYHHQHTQKHNNDGHYQYKYFQQYSNPTIIRNNDIVSIQKQKLSLLELNYYCDYRTQFLYKSLICTFHAQQQQQKPFILFSSSGKGVEAEHQDSTNDDSIIDDNSSTIQYENQDLPEQKTQPQIQYNNNVYYHHTAIKTNNITTSINFYCTLFGYSIECKFRAGPARAVWLMKKDNQHRIELIEVPSYMFEQQNQNQQQQQLLRAVDVFQYPTLLGYNHIAFDVTNSTFQDDTNENNNSIQTITSLQHYITILNKTSIEYYHKTIRVALLPKQQLIGQYVYEIAFIYDPNNCIIELLYYQNTITNQTISSGWDPIIQL